MLYMYVYDKFDTFVLVLQSGLYWKERYWCTVPYCTASYIWYARIILAMLQRATKKHSFLGSQLCPRERKTQNKAHADVTIGSLVQPFSFLKWNQLHLVFKASTITVISWRGMSPNFVPAMVNFIFSKQKVPHIEFGAVQKHTLKVSMLSDT